MKTADRSACSHRVMGDVGGGGRNRTGVHGFAGRCITTLPPRPGCHHKLKGRAAKSALPRGIWSGKRVSNSRPQPWQGCALPTELFPQDSLELYRKSSHRPKRDGDQRMTAAIASATASRLRELRAAT